MCVVIIFLQPRTREEVLSLLAKHGVVDGAEDDKKYSETTLHYVPFLPQQYLFKKANLLVNIRNLQKHEDREAFQILDNMARQGAGLPEQDIPTLACFRRIMLAHGACVVYEDLKSGRMIGWSYSCLSWLTRSASSKALEGTTVIANEYQVKWLWSYVEQLESIETPRPTRQKLLRNGTSSIAYGKWSIRPTTPDSIVLRLRPTDLLDGLWLSNAGPIFHDRGTRPEVVFQSGFRCGGLFSRWIKTFRGCPRRLDTPETSWATTSGLLPPRNTLEIELPCTLNNWNSLTNHVLHMSREPLQNTTTFSCEPSLRQNGRKWLGQLIRLNCLTPKTFERTHDTGWTNAMWG